MFGQVLTCKPCPETRTFTPTNISARKPLVEYDANEGRRETLNEMMALMEAQQEEMDRTNRKMKPLPNRGLLRARRTVSRAWEAVGGDEWWVSRRELPREHGDPDKDVGIFYGFCPELPEWVDPDDYREWGGDEDGDDEGKDDGDGDEDKDEDDD